MLNSFSLDSHFHVFLFVHSTNNEHVTSRSHCMKASTINSFKANLTFLKHLSLDNSRTKEANIESSNKFLAISIVLTKKPGKQCVLLPVVTLFLYRLLPDIY